jgi:hypothetical protein
MATERATPQRGTADGWWDPWIAVIVGLFPLVLVAIAAMIVSDFAISVDDAVSTMQPNTSDTFRQLAAGELPLWSHSTLCGMPLYARGQVLHPGSVVGHLIGLCTGLRDREVTISYLIYLMLGTFSAWLYLRYHGCLRTAATVGAIAFACSGPFWGFWTNWNTYGWAAAMVPPMLLAIDVGLAHRGSFRDGWREACLIGMVLSVMLLVADAQLLVKHALLASGYVLLRADRAAWRRGVPVLVAGAALAGCCGLAQCLAVRDYVGQSTRVNEAGVSLEDFFLMGIPVSGLFGLVDPFLHRFWYAFGTSTFHGAAISIGPLLPVVLGVFFTRAWWSRSVTRSVSVLTVIALLLAIGIAFPPNRLLLLVPVINNFRWPLRWTLEACTVGSLAIGLAVDVLIRRIDHADEDRMSCQRLVRTCAIAFAIAWGLRLLIPQGGEPGAANTVVSSIGWFIGGGSLITLAAVAALMPTGKIDTPRLFRLVAVTVSVASGFLIMPEAQRQRFSTPDLRNLALAPLDIPVGEHERVWPCLTIQKQRELEQGGNLVYGMPHQFNTRSVSGYCFRFPWQGWGRFMGLQGQIDSFEGFHAMVLDPQRKGLLGLLRVGAIAIAVDDEPSRNLLEKHPDFSLQQSTDQLLVYQHTGFREPAWFVEELVTVPPTPLPLHTIDTARVAVAWDQRLKTPVSTKFRPGNRVVSFQEHHSKIDLTLDCPEEGLLVVNDTFYPGWEAVIDGVPRLVGMVDAGFMGVPVPKGATTIALRYRPRWLIGMLVFSTLAWLSLAAVFVLKILPWLVRGWQATVNDAVRRNG